MSDKSKSLRQIQISKQSTIVKEILETELDSRMSASEEKLRTFVSLCDKVLEEELEKRCVKISEKFYCTKLGESYALFPDPESVELTDVSSKKHEDWEKHTFKVDDVSMRMMGGDEAWKLFEKIEEIEKIPAFLERYQDAGRFEDGAGKKYYYIAVVGTGSHLGYSSYIQVSDLGIYHGSYYARGTAVLPIWRIQKGIILPFLSSHLNDYDELSSLLEEAGDITREDLMQYIELYKAENIEKDVVYYSEKFRKELLSGERQELVFGISFNKETILQSCAEEGIPETAMKKLTEKLLNVDKERADLDVYDVNLLYDINRGHWDLWPQTGENQELSEDMISIELDTSFIAGNPIADINEQGVVGIDFGTKSTVVVVLDDHSQKYQMRIGSGALQKKAKRSDYENPTVIEFRDIQSFLEAYRKKSGRPDTKWNDIRTSHAALDSLQASQNSGAYYSYFSNLKQWADDAAGKIRIRDLKQHEEELKDFLEIKADSSDINPIEIYAYYLGLAINNMRNGIYLDYILSYPVNYSLEVKKKIIESFERGIKKSLPEEVLNNREYMDRFRVRAGASEPAAYAISALKEYKLEPKDNEKIFYGVFDFGGGTTDFDFGIWRNPDEKESRRYDYVIEHFGAGGDKYLGGENLLELLAFDVFKENFDLMRENNCPFFKPKERSRFSGSETLLDASQEARLNIEILKSELREFWESDLHWKGDEQGGTENVTDEPATGETTTGEPAPDSATDDHLTGGTTTDETVLDKIKEGKIQVSLYSKNGEIKTLELKVNQKHLKDTLVERIQGGVTNFFEAIKNNFDRPELKDVEQIHIFLAGNSSKSPLVEELFEKTVKEKKEDMIEYFQEKKQDIKADSLFEIHLPLGMKNEENQREEYEKPTGKTGVAYGLLEGRKGSRIKVVSEIESSSEAKFKYYIGHQEKGKFHVDKEREEIRYQEWFEFVDASEEDFELFYSSLPESTTNEVEIERVKRMHCRIKETSDDDNVAVYIRATDPDTIEYAVLPKEDTNKEQVEGAVSIKLDE